jgi:hypothetical protein
MGRVSEQTHTDTHVQGNACAIHTSARVSACVHRLTGACVRRQQPCSERKRKRSHMHAPSIAPKAVRVRLASRAPPDHRLCAMQGVAAQRAAPPCAAPRCATRRAPRCPPASSSASHARASSASAASTSAAVGARSLEYTALEGNCWKMRLPASNLTARARVWRKAPHTRVRSHVVPSALLTLRPAAPRRRCWRTPGWWAR